MKTTIISVISTLLICGIAFYFYKNTQTPSKKMTVSSSGITNEIIADKYGKRGPVNKNGMPTFSLPIKIENSPSGTKSFAVFMEDKDAYGPSGGFAWTHWLVANLTRNEIKENESQSAKDFVQGANSWTSMQGGNQSKSESSYYGGMAPPDAPHTYEIHVYALDTMLPLKPGFGLGEMFQAMEGHILESYTLKGIYNN